MATQPQSRAMEFAGKALTDLASAQRSNLTGQARMIAALLFAHQEEYFLGVVSPGGATVDLSIAHKQIDTKHVKRLEVTERINFILSHLFGVMEYHAGEGAAARWQLVDEWTQAQSVAFRQALRRVLPTVAHIINGAGEGPIIQVEYQDKDMLATGAATAIIPSGPFAGRLKVRQDLAVSEAVLKRAEEAGQDLSKHPPILLDGSRSRTVEAIAGVAKERLGIAEAEPEDAATRALGSISVALQIVRTQFKEVEGHPDLLREKFPSGLVADARAACLVLIHTLFVEPDRPSVVDHEALDREFVQYLDQQRKAA